MTVGADLVVLSVDETRGNIRLATQLGFALAAAELVDLAVRRRIEWVRGTIHVVEALRTGDAVLDAALASLGADRKDITISDWVAFQSGGTVVAHLEAMLESGELEGRMRRVRLDAPAEPVGLRLADSGRRGQLIEKLVDAVLYEAPLEHEAFAALAQGADIPGHILSGRTKHHVEKEIKSLLSWFGDTWRFLPGVSEEFALGDDDIEDGDVNPVRDEPWRLLIRLAVAEALKRTLAVTRKSTSESGLSKDVQTAAFMAYAWDHHL